MKKAEERPPAILFPHCFIDEDRLKATMGLFGSLEICLPWEMVLKQAPVRKEGAPFIKVLRPPEALKPGVGFGKRLVEYRQWMRYHQDKSILAFLSSLQENNPSEEKSWEIRKQMRAEPGEVKRKREDQALKNHLILHFAAETEESQQTADTLMDALKMSRSPLSGALDAEEAGPGFFDDLPSLKDGGLWQGYQWSQILEAWFGLFHQHLGDKKILLTLDPNLTDFLKERFEKALGERADRLFPEAITLQAPVLPPALSIGEMHEKGRAFFPQGILERLERAVETAGDEARSRAGKSVKDPVVESLLGKVLVSLVK